MDAHWRRRRWRAVAVLSAMVLPGCPSGHRSGGAASTTAPGRAPATAPKAMVTALPEGCDGEAPARGEVVAFVAGGRSWSVSPDVPAALHCLFPTPDAGLFSFGPLGDRVALPGLEVRGVGSTVSRPKSTVRPLYYPWSRPTGTTVVFTDGARHRLARADLGAAATPPIPPPPRSPYP